jgi:hypothetical protein
MLTVLHIVLLFKGMRLIGAKAYFTNEAWAVYDVVTYLLCILTLGFHALLFNSGSAIAAASQQLAAQSSFPSNPLISFYSMSRLAAIVESISCVLLFVRCFKFAECVPGVGALLGEAAAKAAAAAKRMASAAIMFAVLTLGFASAACAAFGASDEKWSTVWLSMRSLLTMLFGR